MTSILYKALTDLGLGDWALIIVVASLFVDLVPGIKFNPVRFIVKKLGDAFNHSVDKKLDELESKVNVRIDELESQLVQLKSKNETQFATINGLQKKIDVAEVNRLKMEILNFSNRLSQARKFTAEEYRTIMDCYTRYHDIIDLYEDMSNGKIDVEYNYIEKHYMDHKDEGEYMF